MRLSSKKLGVLLGRKSQTSAINDFLDAGLLLKEVNATAIALIPKQIRPISKLTISGGQQLTSYSINFTSFPPFPIKYIWPSGFLVIILLRIIGR